MAELKLLAAIRARVAERGMTLTDLARATGVQPGNLRRMFASTAASPRLGSVMRLLPPLHGHIAPADARTAAELAAYLDDQRRHQNLDWEQLHDQLGAGADKIAASFLSDPEKLSLSIVMRLADALHVELSLVGDEAQNIREEPTKRRPPASPRRPAPRSRTVHPAPPSSPLAPPASPPVREVAPPTPPSIGPLRPPRLGRYRDATPTPQPVRSPPASWTPREPPSPVAADALVPRLAEISSDQWGDVYAFTWGVLTRGASLPLRFIDGLGRMTEGFMARLRGSPESKPPALPDPPDGWYDTLDPALLVRPWLASRQPDYRPTDILQTYDEHGIRVGHLALDRTTMVAIRLAQHGDPHRLIDLVHLPRDGEAKSWLHTVVPLAVRLGDERHLFRHVKAGPVFGELAAGEHIYLLAAVSSLLVIVEVHGERTRIVWGGRAEKLPKAVLEPPSSPRIDDPAVIIAELERRLTQTEALLAAEHQARADDRRSDTPDAPGQTVDQFASTLHFVAELQTQLSAQAQECLATEQKRLLTEARLKKVVQSRDNLAAELAALRSGAATRPEDPAVADASLGRRLAEVEALLAAERQAREEDRRRHETGQTPQQVENTLRFITELQARLSAQAQERLEAEDKRLIAEDKRVIAEARLKQVANARDELAAELDALRSSPFSHRTQTEQPPTDNDALVDAEHRARHAVDDAARLAQQLAVSQAQEQTIRDALAVTHQELEDVRRAQADEMSKIRELIAAKRFPEAVMHSLARSLGESNSEAVFAHFPRPDDSTAPPETSADNAPSNTKIPAEAAHPVAVFPHRGRRNIVSVAPPTDYPAHHAAQAIRKPGRNEACSCGSGKKYKKCCGLTAT
jgi:hypothetical protein